MYTRTGLLFGVLALLLAFTISSDRVVEARFNGRASILTGTWFLTTPSGLTEFFTFHKGGTLSGAVSSGFGGPPRAGMAKSGDHGIWRRRGRRFEAAAWRFNYDVGSGEAMTITRIRLVFRLDRGWKSGSGEFFVTQWSCPAGGLDCPDPNVADPTVPEFAPPGNTFTITRARL